MITYELINPSDPYTFKAPNIEVAGAVAVLLSTGFGAKPVDPANDETTPILFGWNEWLVDRGINDEWIDAHLEELSAAYDSFIIGSLNQRIDVEKMLALLPDDKREEWKADRQDRHRTSMNAIGEKAAKLAKHFRKLADNSARSTVDASTEVNEP